MADIQDKMKEEVKKNLPKMIERQRAAEQEFLIKAELKERQKQEKLLKQIRLDEIAENLKVRPKVEIDPERVKQVTECIKRRREGNKMW